MEVVSRLTLVVKFDRQLLITLLPGYMLTAASLQLFFGKLYTYLSIKWVFLTAVSIFELGSLICGIAPNSMTLIMGRAVAGLGCAGLMTGGLLVLAHSVPLARRPVYTWVLSYADLV